MFSGKSFINAYILSFVDHFHLIHPGNGQPGTLLWRTSHPVDRCRQRACPVGFDTNILACFVQTVDQRVVYPERRFFLEYHLWTKQWTDMLQASKFSEDKWPLAFELLNNCGGENHEGFIGMQDHGDDVWFRNIRVKVLD